MATTSAQVQQLYVAYLGRAADKAGLDYWLNELNAENATLTLDDLRANFVNEQEEYSDVYGGLSRSDTVIKIYNNLFGRAPDAAGLTYWTTGAGSTVAAEELLVAFINGASTADAKVVANKVLVAEVYTSTAAENYAKADAVSILDGVDGTTTSISDALVKLEDGSLSGIAIPTGVAALKAAAIAEKAVTDFQDSKIADLVAQNKEVQALSEKLGEDDYADIADDAEYSAAAAAIANAKDLRGEVSTSTTVELQEALVKANATQTTATATFKAAAVGNVDLANNLVNAVNTFKGLSAADQAAVKLSTDKVAVDLDAVSDADLATANTAAGTEIETAAQLYTALTDGSKTAAENKAIVDAFTTLLSSSTDFTALKALAVTDYTLNAAEVAVQKATDALPETTAASNFSSAVQASYQAELLVKNAQSADALVVKAEAIEDAHTALTDARGEAQDAVPAFAADFAEDSTAGVIAGSSKVDLFHFADGVTSADYSIDGGATVANNFAKGDAIYVGEGYTLNTAAKYSAADGLTGGNNGALEVFFIKDAGVVKAVIETKDFGSTTVTADSLTTAGSTTDQVSVITLTGVTDVAQVSFANGVISHV